LPEFGVSAGDHLDEAGRHGFRDSGRGITDASGDEAFGIGFVFGDDYGEPARHRLLDDQRQSFSVGGEEHAIGRVVIGGHLLRRDRLVPGQILRTVVQSVPQRTVADHDEVKVGKAPADVEDDLQTLLLHETTGEQNEKPIDR
jgi:hypothetical protein